VRRRWAMDNEEVIIRKAMDGNQQAFRLIVEKYQNIIYGICYNVIKDKQHAENIAQETFLQVYKSLAAYEFKGFKTWISRIALNKSIDYQRKIVSQRKKEGVYIDELEAVPDDQGEAALEGLSRKEDIKRINRLCKELPDIYERIIRKYYINEKCYSQIALEEGISVKTVESRLYRARKILKEKWEEDG
jgi:RNA polymerase sigma factor (sigma-70 family)